MAALAEGREEGAGRGGKSGRGGEGRGPPRRGRASPPPLATASTVPLPAALSSSRPGRRGTAAEEERSAAARAVRTPSGQAWGGGGSAPPPSLLLPPQAQPRSPSPPARKAPDLLRVRARGRCPPRRGSLPPLPLAPPAVRLRGADTRLCPLPPGRHQPGRRGALPWSRQRRRGLPEAGGRRCGAGRGGRCVPPGSA